jgi:Transposase DDE domain
MQDLENIIMKFEKIVSSNFCDELAKKCGFVQRSTSQLRGYEFAQAMMIPNAFLEAETLNSLAVRMQKININCNLSASALAQRINTKSAEKFMKACFGKFLKEITKKDFAGLSDLQNLSVFNRILIEDSTKAELHEKLSPHFKGTGGAASKSAIKIDFIFDYLSEEVVDIEFFSGNIPDQSIARRINSILQKDDLILRDLGYYALDRLKEIEQAGAYQISRMKADVVVFRSKEATKPLDLAKFLDQRIFQGVIDVEIFIGKEKHPVRLVACLMSEEAVNKRLRAANRTGQRHGTKMSKKKASLLKYCIFITNIPVTMLPSTSIMATYRARWRIELVFKQWKSCLKIHLFKGYNKERFHCFLYGRLIMVLLLGAMFPPLMRYASELGRELSCYKLANYIIADHGFPIAFQENKVDKFLEKLLKDITRRLCMDKRKRHSLRSNIRMGNSYYKPLEMIDLYTNIA